MRHDDTKYRGARLKDPHTNFKPYSPPSARPSAAHLAPDDTEYGHEAKSPPQKPTPTALPLKKPLHPPPTLLPMTRLKDCTVAASSANMADE